MADETKRPQWEPPPWEAAAFEAIKAKREAEAADAEIAAALDALTEEEPEPARAPEPAPAEPAAEAPEPEAAVKPKQEQAKVDAMLIHLKVEEPDTVRDAWVIGAIGTTIVGVVGIVTLMFGLVGFSKTGSVPAGAMASGILLLFGAGLTALAAWLGWRTLKYKGVV